MTMLNKAACALMLAGVPLAAQSFEGTVSMTITGENSPRQSMTYMLKDGKMRFELGGGKMAAIIDPAAQRVMVIMNAQKMYMEQNFGSVAAAMEGQPGGAKGPTITRTGKMETIAGYACEHVIATDDDGQTVDICLSSELGGFRMPTASNPMAPQRESGWIAQLGAGKFPLKAVKNGKTILEVTAIDKKPLDAALFTAPEGFQSFQMPSAPKRPARN
jgi:hypothetical protein